MHSHHHSSSGNPPMLVASPRCSFNCQGLSIHLPPLGGRRDTSSGGSYISPPMSASYSQQHFDRSSPKLQRSHPKPSDSPPSRPSTSGKRSPTSSKTAYLNRAVAKDIRTDLSTPSSTDFDTSATSLQQSSDTGKFRGESNDEVSSNPQDSPEAQQLIPGPPGIARRSKAHVPSACVNCKKKHLACETKRPCNRCVQTGKESSCVDVQHKKRGRPRLREEESIRDLTFRSDYQTDELYQGQNGVLGADNSSRHRSKTYRELRSQPESPYNEHRPRTSDTAYSHQQYVRGSHGYSLAQPAASFLSEHIPTALLSMDFVVAQHNRALSDALSLSFTARGQALQDLVVPTEKERIRRLQSSMRAELRDAAHAPFMNGGPSPHASIPAIEHLDLARVTAGFRTRSEYWTFRLPREQSRGFPISMSLAREAGGPFVILTLVQNTSSSPALQSPTLQQGYRNQHILPSSSSVQLVSSPPKSAHPAHHHNHINGASDLGNPYLMSATSPTLDDPLLPLHATNGLAQYKQSSPPRSVQLPYNTSRTDSSGSTSSIPRSSPGNSHQPLSRDHLRDLQLPPIRTTPTSDPSAHKDDSSSRRRYQSGTPSPSRSSPHNSKRKKRRRVEIGDLMH